MHRANETAALRLETIASQKREIEQLKGGGGDKSASSSIPSGDDAASQLILVLGQAYKVPAIFITLVLVITDTYLLTFLLQKTRNDPDDQCYWLAFACNLLDMFCKAAATDDNLSSSVLNTLPDLPHGGVVFNGGM